MNTEHNTSLTLKYSVFVSVFIVIVGLILYMADMGDRVLWAGLLMVIISPLLGVVVTTISLWMERDLKWMYIALLLIAISVIGILLK